MKLGCVVMAAGMSRRFGGDKLLADVGGKPMLCRTLESLPREVFARILAVVRRQEVQRLCEDLGVPALRYGGGAHSMTIRLGMERMMDLDGCLFLPGDQPLCRRESIRALADAFEAEPDRVCRLAWDGSGGSPVIFPKRLFPELLGLTGEQGGMAAARRERDICLVQAGFFWELLDGDTREDLEQIRSLLGHAPDMKKEPVPE